MEEQKNFTNVKIAVIVHIQINAKRSIQAEGTYGTINGTDSAKVYGEGG